LLDRTQQAAGRKSDIDFKYQGNFLFKDFNNNNALNRVLPVSFNIFKSIF
jgi:hypothetical protein